MIYLKDRKLLFVKPKKTAGTSVEIALSCNATDQDIVTPITREDEKKRWEVGGKFPCNWAWLSASERRYKERFEAYLADGTLPRVFLRKRPGRLYDRKLARFYNHITPAQIRRRAGAAFLDESFLVTMARHPYELVVSMASYRHAFGDKSLDWAVEDTLRRKPLNLEYTFGPKRPDFVIRYERLRDDLAELEKKFDLELVDKLPFTKHNTRKDRRPASEILTEEQKTRIQTAYRQAFDTYGFDT